MRIFRFLISFLILILLCFKISSAQWDNWFHYTVLNSNLPSNIVNYVEVDENNVKWIASGSKLVRMENQQMTIFSPDSVFEIYELGEIAVDNDNNKWVRSLFNGVLKFDNQGNWTQFNRANGFPGSDSVTAVSIDSNNRVWVGSFQGISMWDGVEWTHYSAEEYLPHRIINAIEVDKNNNIWVGTFDGLTVFDGNNWNMIDTSDYHLPSRYIISLDINMNNEIFIGTRAGVATYDGLSWSLYNPTTDNDKLNNNVWTINALDRDLWIGFKYDYDRIAAKNDSSEWFFFGPENSALPPNDMQCIAVDDSNHVFFATYRGGLVEFWDDRSYRDSTNLLVADFIATPILGYEPLNVQFTDKSTGSPTTWHWDFGDGETSNQQNPNHTYENSGTYTASLQVDNINGSDTLTKIDYIVVLPAVQGEAHFTCNPLKGCIPLAVSFKDRSTGAVQSWSWNFGDGGTSTEQNPIHTYTNPGIYSINLTVQYDGYQSSHSRVNFVEVVNCDTVLLELLTPYDGARLISKTIYPITWEVAPNINYVNIWFSTDNGLNWELIGEHIKSRPEHLTWNVPDIEAPYCLMKIEDYDNNEVYDVNTFSIISKITVTGKDTLKVCADMNGKIVQTSFKSDPGKTYRLTFQGTYSLLDRLNACPNEGDLSCGFDAAYVYDIENTQISQGLWPPKNILTLPKPFTDTTTYPFAGTKSIKMSEYTGFRFNGLPLNVPEYKSSHKYIVEKQGTGDYFYFSIIDSIMDSGQILPQYDDDDDCISIIIEEIDTIEVDYCGFEFIRDSIDTTKIIGMQLDAGIFVRDTMSITGKRNILAEIDPDELGVVVNGKFICPIDSIVCDDIVTRSAPPVKFGLVVDKSNSMNDQISQSDNTIRLNAMKSSLSGFVDNMREQDEAFIVSFSDNYNLDQDWTNNKNLLKSKISAIQASGWTQLWGAVNYSFEKILPAPVPKAMIILSDGGNTENPYLSQINLINKVKNTTELPIYIIALGLSDSDLDINGRDSLNMIAEASGGKLFDINDADDLNNIYNDILLAETQYECCRIYFSGEIDSCGWVKLIYSPERDDIITRAFDYCGYDFTNTMIRDFEDGELNMKVSPNPINESAKIEFNLTNTSNVQLQILDMIGKPIMNLELGTLPQGHHQHYLDSKDIQSGTYMAIVKSKGFVLNRKVVVIH